MSTETRKTKIWGAVAIALVAAWWYWSPYWAMYAMKSAAAQKDADTFNQYVDYPKVRDSLKGQFAVKAAKIFGEQKEQSGFAALGAMLGVAMVDRLVDSLVTPQAMMAGFNEAKLRDAREIVTASDSKHSSTTKERKLDWLVVRPGIDRVVAYGSDEKAAPKEDRLAFVFDRTGFASWRLTELRMPESDK